MKRFFKKMLSVVKTIVSTISNYGFVLKRAFPAAATYIAVIEIINETRVLDYIS